MANRLSLTFASDVYDRTWPLLGGTVQPQGIDLRYLVLSGGTELFRRVAQNDEFDVAEMSMSTYMLLKSLGDQRYVGIPVFLSRCFRHGFTYVNDASGIKEPKDLVGKRVGIVEYQVTAGLWWRAILQHEYGVKPGDMTWYISVPPEQTRFKHDPPPGVTLLSTNGKRLYEMLEQNEIDAQFVAPYPFPFDHHWAPNVHRLFPNHREVEKAYYKKTGFFPINHMVVIRRELYEKNRWVAMNLYKAFQEAKQVGFRRLTITLAPFASLPWLQDDIEEMHRDINHDPFVYGISANRKILEAMTDYSLEQGLSKRKLSLDEMFAAETMDT